MLSDKGPWNDPEILQLLYSGKMNPNIGEFHGMPTVEDAWLSAQSTPDGKSGQFRKEGDRTHLLETIKQLQVTAKEAEKRFQAMEVAFRETKQLLQRCSEQIKDLQIMFEKSNIS